MLLIPEVAADLVAIRTLRDLAGLQARSPGGVHRQVAVILLDAAIERTVFSAAEYLGYVFSDRDLVDKPLHLLKTSGLKVPDGVETSRKRLHRARNVVQHAGVGVDRDELPGWVIATTRFIDGVVQFAYDTSIDDVQYSSAVSDGEVRELLQRAEQLLMQGEVQGSASIVVEAFDAAMMVWSKFVVGTNRSFEPRHGSYTEFGTIGGDDPKVLALQKLTELTTIAAEPSEAVWFLEAKTSIELLNSEEVSRALVFVVTLTVAIEGSPAAQRIDRLARHAIQQRRAKQIPGDKAHLDQYHIQDYGDSCIVSFKINNVPDVDEYDEWSSIVTSELNAIEGDQRFNLQADGTLDIYNAGSDISIVMDRVESVFAGADETVIRTRAKMVAGVLENKRLRDAFEERLSTALTGRQPSWLALSVVDDGTHPNRPWVIAASLSLSPGVERFPDIWDAFRDIGWPAYGSGSGWVLQTLEPEQVPEFISKLTPVVERLISDAEDRVSRQRQQLNPIDKELRRRGYVPGI